MRETPGTGAEGQCHGRAFPRDTAEGNGSHMQPHSQHCGTTTLAGLAMPVPLPSPRLGKSLRFGLKSQHLEAGSATAFRDCPCPSPRAGTQKSSLHARGHPAGSMEALPASQQCQLPPAPSWYERSAREGQAGLCGWCRPPTSWPPWLMLALPWDPSAHPGLGSLPPAQAHEGWDMATMAPRSFTQLPETSWTQC